MDALSFSIFGKNVSTFVHPSLPYLSSHRNISVIAPSNLHFLTSLYYTLIVFRIICLAIKHYKNISVGYYGTDKRYDGILSNNKRLHVCGSFQLVTKVLVTLRLGMFLNVSHTPQCQSHYSMLVTLLHVSHTPQCQSHFSVLQSHVVMVVTLLNVSHTS